MPRDVLVRSFVEVTGPRKFSLAGQVECDNGWRPWTVVAWFRPKVDLPFTAEVAYEWVVMVYQDRDVEPARYPLIPDGGKTLVDCAVGTWLKGLTRDLDGLAAERLLQAKIDSFRPTCLEVSVREKPFEEPEPRS